MRFQTLLEVDDIENPYYSTITKSFKTPECETPDHDFLVRLSADILIRNKIVTAALEIVGDSSDGIRLGHCQLASCNWERAAVITDTVGGGKLDRGFLHPDQVLIIPDLRLRGKILMFQLKDFSCIAEYSIRFISHDKLEDGEGAAAVVKVKPNLDFEKYCVFEFDYPTQPLHPHIRFEDLPLYKAP